MATIMTIFRRAAVSGTAAGCAAAVTAARRAAGDGSTPYAPINAVAYCLWPRSAFSETGPSARFTLTGLAIHQSSAVFWGVLYETWMVHRYSGDRMRRGDCSACLYGRLSRGSKASDAGLRSAPFAPLHVLGLRGDGSRLCRRGPVPQQVTWRAGGGASWLRRLAHVRLVGPAIHRQMLHGDAPVFRRPTCHRSAAAESTVCRHRTSLDLPAPRSRQETCRQRRWRYSRSLANQL
jgi:hypothetical protein